METRGKRVKTWQPERLSPETPFGVMRQSELAGNEPREGAPKSLPANRTVGLSSNSVTRACSPTPQEVAASTIERLGNQALLNVPCDDLKYAAGFFDGEGCIQIATPKKQKNTYYVYVRVNNTNLNALEFMRRLFGGSVFAQPRTNLAWSPTWGWVVCSRKAEAFLRAVLPYLVIKKRQAEKAIELQGTLVRGDHHVSEERLSKRAALKSEIAVLKTVFLDKVEELPSYPYLAGFFDAEGTVQVGVHNGTPCLQIRITNTEKALLDKIRGSLGGSVCSKSDKGRITPCWHWLVYSKKAASVLREMMPNLIVKREQARLAIEFQGSGAGRVTGFVYRKKISELNTITRNMASP